jgi:hypothetical protein
MATRIIESKQNARVKELRAALLRPGRGDPKVVALEGLHLVSEAAQRCGNRNSLRRAGQRKSDHEAWHLRFSRGPGDASGSAGFRRFDGSPQPIAALAQARSWTWPDLIPAPPSPSLIVLLAGIQDPGNLGTILRSAEAFGATGAVCLPRHRQPVESKSHARLRRQRLSSSPDLGKTSSLCFEPCALPASRHWPPWPAMLKPLGGHDLAPAQWRCSSAPKAAVSARISRAMRRTHHDSLPRPGRKPQRRRRRQRAPLRSLAPASTHFTCIEETEASMSAQEGIQSI